MYSNVSGHVYSCLCDTWVLCIPMNPVMCIHVYAIHGCYVFLWIQSCVYMYMRYMGVMYSYESSHVYTCICDTWVLCFVKQTLLTDRLTDRKRKGGMDGECGGLRAYRRLVAWALVFRFIWWYLVSICPLLWQRDVKLQQTKPCDGTHWHGAMYVSNVICCLQ